MTVVGLGIEGIDLVRYLTVEGAAVTVSDSRTAMQLREQIEAVADCDPHLSLGENRTEDATNAEVVFVSQGVPTDLPALRAARREGVPVSSMTQLFLDRCPAPVAGITGSSGKTTTTALTAAMLDASGVDYVVGGNIGIGLLSLLERIEPTTKVVVELSHTQLEMVEESPALACVTNVTPNHLDHYSWSSYVDLKRRIFQFQAPEDLAIFNLDDEVCAGFVDEAAGRVATTSMTRDLPGDGALLLDDTVVRREAGEDHAVIHRDEIPLRGEHNVANVLSATAVASRLGAVDAAIAEAVRTFRGVPHRLEPVTTIRDVLYVNDSIATTPERTIAGLRSYEEPLVLLLGGRDKRLPLREMAALAVERCRAVITFGEAGDLFAEAVREAQDGDTPSIERVADVAAAVRRAADRARAGDVVLFSPAGTSFDAYRTFEVRGADFRAAVANLEVAR
ncbi:MAG: UDP-N-acetylmuramoyl-L-alanine--D-glutamate ligase [SAR202 cluster bacterium Casp-Chloro-G1]|nr:MAG: UDP-N-acetylmuramoyl-L-alanine--D-glutamate ligase [SAR202 cluster bacterium Casp-Chloro-G1]